MPPTVSVVVPTYNRAASLPNALGSILAQTFHDLEILVVDDGSDDQTRQLVASLNHPAIHYFHQENRGAGAARNLGVAHSRGEYIAFLDSDDRWLEGKLDQQLETLRSQKSPGCVTGYWLHPVRGKEVIVIPGPKEVSLRGILWKNRLQMCTTLVCRRSVFEHVGAFDEDLLRGQDTDWLIRYRNSFDISIVPEPLAVFNQHLVRSGKAMERSSHRFLEKHQSTLRDQGRLFQRRKAAHIYQDLAYQYSREGNAQKAHHYTRRSLSSFPILSPGIWLLFVDSLLGTRLKPTLDAVRYPGYSR